MSRPTATTVRSSFEAPAPSSGTKQRPMAYATSSLSSDG